MRRREMRSQCPVAHSARYDGFWVVTRYDDPAQVIHDHDRFSSKIVMIPRDLLTGFDGQPFPAPPLTADPPFHTKFRKMLLPSFTRPQIQKWEETTVAIADSHIAGLQGRDVIDASAEYAEYIPIGVIARMMGVPEDDAPKFTDWVHRLFTSAGAVEEARAAIIEMFQYLWAQIAGTGWSWATESWCRRRNWTWSSRTARNRRSQWPPTRHRNHLAWT